MRGRAWLATASIVLTASAASAAPVTLKWGVGQGGQFLDLYKEVARLFEERNPNVKIELIQAGYDQLREKVVVAHAAGTPIDLFEAHSQYLAELAESGIIADLGPFIAADRDLRLQNYIPVTVTGNQWKGKQVGLPVAAFMDVMYYNRRHFADAGLPEPPRPQGCRTDSCPQWWDWTDLENTLRKLQRDTNGDGKPDQVGLQMTSFWSRIMPFIFQAGGHLFDENYSRAILDQEPAVETLTFLQNLQSRGLLAGSGFFEGRTTMYVSGPWDLPGAIQAGIDFDVAMLPRYRHFGTRASNLPIHMSSITPHKKEAWEFIKFLLSPEVQRQLTRKVEWLVPAYIPAALEYTRRSGPPASKHVFYEQMVADPGHRILSHPLMPKIGPIVQGAFDRIWRGETAVRPALQEATRQINALLAGGR